MHYSSNLGLKFNFHDEIFSDTIQAYQSTSESESDCGSFKILIVDDDPVNIQVLSNQLSLMNYSISTATNGMKVLDMIQSGENFDLILLDIMMPKLSGYEVCKEIRKVASANELPIIFITAKSLVSDLIIGFESGANDYIVKPFDKRELLTRVRTALRLKEAFNERQELIQMEKELSIAEMVQRSVLTSKEYYCKIEYLDIDVQYIPINKKVGGDYYNISILSDASTSIMIADATGHGIQAALSTMQIDILNKQSLVKHNPPLRLKYINELLINEIKSKNFFSAFMLEINKEKILYSSAGQSTQLLIKGKTKELKYLQTKGKLIGIKQNVTYKMEEETIESGDIIFLFTDGIFEEFNSQNEQFGEARFFKLVNKILTDFPDTYPMAEINTLIIKEVEAFIKDAEFNDDITLIGIRVL